MSSNPPAIAVRGLSKSYTIRRNAAKHTTLADALVDRIRHPFRRTEKEVFWALRDLNFEVSPGEIVGIIGRNGAGKSTLLKILSRITRPTSGEIELRGRVGSLLEVGTGFHQELTGRENIYLSGTILGMKHREIKEQFDAIVEFAGVEQFLDTPVKRYSSGMYVRLAFAVAAHLSSEILLIDEVLAVGDAEFQKKCLGKMRDVATGGRTVLFVSHHMHSILLLCSRAIYLEKGRLITEGETTKVISHYLAAFREDHTQNKFPAERSGSGEYRFVEVSSDKGEINPSDTKQFRYRIVHCKNKAGKMFLSAGIFDENGTEVVKCDSRLVGFWLDDDEQHCGEMQVHSLWLKPGTYRIDMFICTESNIIDKLEGAIHFTVSSLLPYSYSASQDAIKGAVLLTDFRWVAQ